MSKTRIVKYLPIVEVGHGLMNRFDDSIEINKYLKKFPKLYQPMFQHELQHSDVIFSLEDFKHDLNSEHKIKTWDLLLFIIKHPKSLTQYLPIYWTRKRKWVVDINLCIMYSIFFIISWIIISFIF